MEQTEPQTEPQNQTKKQNWASPEKQRMYRNIIVTAISITFGVVILIAVVKALL